MERFNEYGFPAVYPAAVLAEMQEALPLSPEEFRLLHLCFDAANNLYSLIPLGKLYEICCKFLPVLSEEAFLQAAEVIAHEKGNYYQILRKEIFYEDQTSEDPMDRELVANHLYEIGAEYYYKTKKAQEGKPWYTPDWPEFVKYADHYYYEETSQLRLMSRYLQNAQRKLRCSPEDIVDQLTLHFQMDQDIQGAIDEAQRFGVRFQDDRDFRNFLSLLLKLGHHTRRYHHRGHTPAELGLPEPTISDTLEQVTYDNNYIDPFQKAADLFRAFADRPTTTSGKPSRNAPCPCGSGRKYKNCCGK